MTPPQMKPRRRWVVPAFLIAVAVVSGACSERLLTPVNCPELCPGGQIVVYDTVLTPIPGSDSSFVGYVAANTATGILVSNNLPAADARGFVQFLPRNDSVFVQDTLRSYTIDSAKVNFTVDARDSLQPGLVLLLYKLPPTIDSTATFDELTAAFTSEAFLDSVEVPDTLLSGRVTALLSGETLSRIALTPADSGVLRVGVALTAPAATGIRLLAVGAGTGGPTFQTYVHADVADTTLQKQTITRVPSYNTYLTAVPFPQPTPTTLLVGGAPSARALMRFDFPLVLKDTAEIIRATLELVPVAPITGLSNVNSTVVTQGILVDLGAKSPLLGDITGLNTFKVPSSAVMSIEVLNIVRALAGQRGATPGVLRVAVAGSVVVLGAGVRLQRGPGAPAAPAHRVRAALPVRTAMSTRRLAWLALGLSARAAGDPGCTGLHLRRARPRLPGAAVLRGGHRHRRQHRPLRSAVAAEPGLAGHAAVGHGDLHPAGGLSLGGDTGGFGEHARLPLPEHLHHGAAQARAVCVRHWCHDVPGP